MNTCSFISLALLFVLAPVLSAADAHARLIYNNKSKRDVYVQKYTNAFVIYKVTKESTNTKKESLAKLDSVYFYEPILFTEGMELYNNRKYKEAKEKFLLCKKAFENLKNAPNNYSTLAGFYSLECSRKMLDLETLVTEKKSFDSEGLVREYQLTQLKINDFWKALYLKKWKELVSLGEKWESKKVTTSQRAQISYCYAVGLENLAKEDPELFNRTEITYNFVFSADFTASSELLIAATNHLLGMYANDPQVKEAISFWKTKKQKKGSIGYQRLIRAASLVNFYNLLGFDSAKPLSEEYKKFLKYMPPKEKATDKKAAPKKNASEKKAEKGKK